jgi:voltage-gated potassium channel
LRRVTVRFPPPNRRALRFLTPGVALVLLLSAGAFAAVETESVHSYWEGLWWSLSLVSTVGFAGATPTTAVGKLVSAALMVLGFVLLATTTAAVASLFVREDELPEDKRALDFGREMLDALRGLDARLEAIEEELRTSGMRTAKPAIGRPVDGSKPTPRSSGRSMPAPARGGQAHSDNRHTTRGRGK